MTDIYTAFDKATSSMTAVALVMDGVAVGRVVIKRGAAVTAYVQIWGSEMAKGRAGGGGYDRATAAVGAAIAKIYAGQMPSGSDAKKAWGAIAIARNGMNGGEGWERVLEAHGFTIARVI